MTSRRSPSQRSDSRPRPSSRRARLLALLVFLGAAGIGEAFLSLVERTGRERARGALTEAALLSASELEKHLDRIHAAAAGLTLTVEAAAARSAEPAPRAPGGAGGGALPPNAAARVADREGLARRLGERFPGVRLEGVFEEDRPAARPEESAAGELVRPALEDRDLSEVRDFLLLGPVASATRSTLLLGLVPLEKSGPGGSSFGVLSLDLRQLLDDPALTRLVRQGNAYVLSSRFGERPVVLARSTEMPLAFPVEVPVRPRGGQLTLQVAPQRGWEAGAKGPRGHLLILLLATASAVFANDLVRRPEILEREVELRTRRLVEANRQVLREALERERAEKRLLHEASHDQLTGLPNRSFLLSRLQRALDKRGRGGEGGFSLVLLVVDRFKSLNESLGPAAGDLLLKATARRLERAVRPGDVAARTGNAEFGVLLHSVADRENALAVTARLRESCASPLSLGGQDLVPTASAGIVLGATLDGGAEDGLRDAEVALHRAQGEGTGRQVLFEREMRERVLRLKRLETDLKRALERDELRVYYQPVVSLASGRMSGFEALVRWQHPESGLVPPNEFIPMAESTGLVVPLDRWVWRQAARDIRALNERLTREPLTVSVNLSTRQLHESDLLPEIERTLGESGIPPRLFRLEITESMMLEDTGAAVQILGRMKALGIRLLLDDFGTGYSSLSYLHELPIDILKVDRSFVSRVSAEGREAEIVKTIVALGHSLGMDVVAEGVETPDQLERLRSLGANYGQGYLFGRPMPLPQVEPLLGSRW